MTIFLFLFLGIICSLFLSNGEIFGELGTVPPPTSHKVLPTYVVDITTGSGISYKFQHFYPLNIAIPVGTTVAWFNYDPEAIHTVTSGAPGSPNSGKMFNSGIIPYSGSLQYTFDTLGRVAYHCEIHPWMIGSIYVSDSFKEGNNIKLNSGSDMGLMDNSQYDWVFNATKNDRILLDFQPTSINFEKTVPLSYNITLHDDKKLKTIFSRTFVALGNDLQIELISSNLDDILVYGPDFNDPIIGAYHVRSNNPDGEYSINAKITAVGSNLTQSEISDKFKGIIVS